MKLHIRIAAGLLLGCLGAGPAFAAPDLSFNSALFFAPTNIGVTSAPVTTTLSNAGSTANNIVCALFGSDAANFAIVVGAPTTCVPNTQDLANGESCDIAVTFSPTAKNVNSFSGNLVCTPNNGLAPGAGINGSSVGCFNGVTEAGETCDDGNGVDGDGCESCQLVVCGNGVVEGSEACDDSNTADGDGCSADCLSDESCGNGVTDANALIPEVCDDGNTAPGDGCSADCLSDESCGNGTLDVAAGEDCDDGNTANGDCCDNACFFETLGSSCDDSNSCTPTDECDGAGVCAGTGTTCGDGTIDGACGEQCDDSGTANGDGCSSTCLNEFCGDGSVNDSGSEDCDDGNTTNGDGCSSACEVEPAPATTGGTTGTDTGGDTGGDTAGDTGGETTGGDTGGDTSGDTGGTNNTGGGCSLVR